MNELDHPSNNDRRRLAYLRVSSPGQATNGRHGFANQLKIVEEHAREAGLKIIDVYEEVASGDAKTRPKLDEAVRRAELEGIRILVARDDRLARDAEVGRRLLNSGMFEIASTEARIVGAEEHLHHLRRSAALGRERARAKGVRFGSPNPERGGQAAARLRRDKADRFALTVLKSLKGSIATVPKSPTELAKALNDRGISSYRGGAWTRSTAHFLLKRWLRIRQERAARPTADAGCGPGV